MMAKAAKKPAAKKPAAKKAVPKALAKIKCVCDRLPLEDGRVLVRDMVAQVPAAHAEAYIAQERAIHA